MAASLASFKETVEKLIRRFESDRAHYLSKAYPEAQARVDFITPFFKGLGWDVENEAGLPHFEREVVVEHGEADTPGRPDYSFRIGGQTKFFAEAKAPSEALDDARHVLQATGYAWNTKAVFFVVLTNFEEFRFYDGSLTPDERSPGKGLLFKLGYADYLAQLQKLWEFSRERVAAGSLDAMLPRDRRTERLRIPVDEAFLDEMTGWREELARDIYKNNRDLTARQLNEVVQRLLDRIVFIRIAEDRRMIERYQLRAAAEEWRARGGKFDIGDWLRPLFEKINEDFNGEIFKPNELLETTRVDSEVLAKIIERLYPPKSPYRFDVIGVELLGSIYERYLGKTIRPTAKTVRVEEKPEVRKAGGVYYTPKYIVDYIVKNTVGKIIEGKTPKQIEKIRILDPACGSGSFLIGAFQCLIDYHVRYLTEHPKEARVHPLFPDLIKGETGEPRLSVIRKARILRNNLFGVDIDPQAVEITMMSLYLKALEGEKSQLPPKQSLLPELKYNIICGNSLIGPDIYAQGTLFGDAERDRINAFDWYSDSSVAAASSPPRAVAAAPSPPHVIPSASEESAFPGVPREQQTPRGVYPEGTEWARGDSVGAHGTRHSGPVTIPDIMRSGGFDSVIGNPPYVRIQHMKEWAPFEVEHYKERYKSAGSGNYDIYVVFVEKGLGVLKKGGRLGYILPHKFFNAKYGEPLRSLIAEGKHLSRVVHFGDQQVFDGATNYTCLLFLEKDGKDKFQFAKVDDLEAWRTEGKATEGMIPARRATASEWNFAVGKSAALFEKLAKMPVKLGEIASRIAQGIRTSDNYVYVLDLVSAGPKAVVAHSKALDRNVKLERQAVSLFLQGREIKPYRIEPSGKVVIIPYKYESDGGDVRLVTPQELRSQFRRTLAYFGANKSRLENREHGRMRGNNWYAYIYPKNIEIMKAPKILIPDIAARASFALDDGGQYAFTSGYGITLRKKVLESRKYILGLLNSKLLDFYLKSISTIMRGGFFRYFTQFIEQLPIRTIDFSDPADKARHDKMVELVERMLELNKRKHSVAAMSSSPTGGGDAAATDLERDIARTDAEIDNLVYELYGITDEERKIIEGD